MVTFATSSRRKAPSIRNAASRCAIRFWTRTKARAGDRPCFQKSDALYLATDPDREGEAIVAPRRTSEEFGALEGKDVYRVVFYEITRNAIREAIENPRHISQDLVNAQQARRALDYLVGFNLSPLLWKKAGLPGASAGRGVSPALRMICEREEEIAANPGNTGPSTRMQRKRTRRFRRG